jgi:iron complex outermembrane receptor protein
MSDVTRIAAVASWLLAISSNIGLAQVIQVASQKDEALDAGGQLGEIVVTAQRRSESLQDVPVSVTALSGDTIGKTNSTGGYDIQALVPALTMTTSSGAVTPFIRGVGNPVTSGGNEAAVSIYIDGIYIARVSPAELEFNNIERVEVLKGPQGTLFGRNSTGGLVNIVTPDPGKTPSIAAEIGFANYNTTTGSVNASAPVNDVISGSVSMVYRNQGEGWGRNLVTGGQTWFDKYLGLRTKWVVRPSDSTKITFSGDYIQDHQDLSLYQSAYPGTTLGNPPGSPPVVYPSSPAGSIYNTMAGQPALERINIFGGSVRLDQELAFADVVSITAYRKGRSDENFDVDYVPVDYFNANLMNQYNQFSQEFQLVSKKDSTINWIVGTYYLRTQDGYNPSFLGGSEFGGVTAAAYGTQTINSKAGYAQATATIAPDTKLTLGARYTIDDVAAAGRTDILLPDGTVLFPGTEVNNSRRFTKGTWHAVLDHKFTENVLGYLSASTGYKSGLFATLPISTTPVQPETIDAYELGAKTEFLDHRLRVNFAGYYYRIKDLQVQLLEGPSVQLLNAPKASTRGADLDVDAVMTSHLSAHFGVSYLKATYDDFNNAPVVINPSRLIAGKVPGCSAPAVLPSPGNGGNTGFCSANVDGNQIVRSPTLTSVFMLDYSTPFASGTLDITGNVSYSSGFYWDPDNFLKQNAFTLLGGSTRYTLPSGHTWISLWAKNITNQERFNGQSEQSFNFGNPGSPAAPRTFGISVGVKY